MSKAIPNAVTVRQLLKLCQEQVKKGNGDKDVVISGDDEGNEFHTLFYGFVDTEEGINYYAEAGMLHDNNNPKDCVILG